MWGWAVEGLEGSGHGGYASSWTLALSASVSSFIKWDWCYLIDFLSVSADVNLEYKETQKNALQTLKPLLNVNCDERGPQTGQEDRHAGPHSVSPPQLPCSL